MADEYDDTTDWVAQRCRSYASTDTSALLESLFDDPRCRPFGPLHHFIVGAVLITCFRNAQGTLDVAARDADLAELALRSANVPGAACAKWGVCGAAASAGMAYAIIRENAPLRVEGWSEDQTMVADILQCIARSGAPRCCKRDSRIAVSMATDRLNMLLEHPMEVSHKRVICRSIAANSVCLGSACPYHPNHRG